MNVTCSSLRSRLTVPHISSLMFVSHCHSVVPLLKLAAFKICEVMAGSKQKTSKQHPVSNQLARQWQGLGLALTLTLTQTAPSVQPVSKAMASLWNVV